MQLPQYTTKMRRFFELAFQQTQVTSADYADQFYPKQIDENVATTPLLLQNLQESFARTMLALIAAGQPLTAATTTNQLMMTTALKELYAFLDVWEVDDSSTVTDRFKKANPKLQITVETAGGPIPIADTLDPTSANYMHWYNPDAATEDSSIAGCAMDPIVYPPSAFTLHWLLYGVLDGRKLADGTNCPNANGSATAAQLAASDFTDWTLVTIRPPKTGEAPSTFYDLPALRSATTLVLSIPRVGFFSTPAFFANWQTNTSNQMRVTMNQTLIVALGASVDGTDPTAPPTNPPPGLDTVHAAGGACAHCHVTLDPTRSIFAASYSWNYHDQLDTSWSGQPGEFIFQGVVQPVTSMADLGSTLAAHPFFAAAWVEKLCTYANSGPCDAADPEFQRLVSLFQGSNYSWNTLVAELFASPLTTNATPTETTAAHGEIVAVSRRDHLCAALDNRLGLSDVCGLEATTKKQLTATVPQIVSGLPSDGYGRGVDDPGPPQSTVAVLPRGDREHLRGGGGGGHRRGGRQADRRRDLLVEQRSRRRHRRLRLDGDGAGPGRSALRRGQQRPARALHGGAGAGAPRPRPLCSRPSSRPAWRRPRSRSECRRQETRMITRRQGLKTTLFGAGLVGLRALATGLPPSFLLNPRRAFAGGCAADVRGERQGPVRHLQHLGQRRPDQRQRARDLRGSQHRSQRRSHDGGDRP